MCVYIYIYIERERDVTFIIHRPPKGVTLCVGCVY